MLWESKPLGVFLVKSNMIRSHEMGPEPQLFQEQSQENHKFKARLDTIVRCYLKVKSGRGVEIYLTGCSTLLSVAQIKTN